MHAELGEKITILVECTGEEATENLSQEESERSVLFATL